MCQYFNNSPVFVVLFWFVNIFNELIMSSFSRFVLIALLLSNSIYSVHAQTEMSSNISAISYNIRLSAALDGSNSWLKRRAASVEMIQQEAPLLIGLQEAMYNQVRYLDRHLNNYKRIGVGRDDGKRNGEFMAVYYDAKRCNLLDAGTFWLSETPTKVSRGWDAACHRTLTWLKLEHKASGNVFYVFNTHLDHQGQVARKQSIILIDSLINAVVPPNMPVILMGDFNMTADDERLAIIVDTFDESRNCSPITDNRGTYNAFKADFKPITIDFIFSQKLRCKAHRTLDGDYGVPFISDHYPIAFDFEFVK
jgi:endonuclease/exonuclease/phosphatase family metal-dependent hydrolase